MPHGVGLFVQNLLQFLAKHLALGQGLMQIVAPDRLAKSRLRAHGDGVVVILHFKHCFLRVPHHPEDDGVHVHRNGVARERGFSRHVGNPHALIHNLAQSLDHRHNHEDAWSNQTDIPPESQLDGLFPLPHNLDCRITDRGRQARRR